MITFSGKALFCDVDDTLIFWEEPEVSAIESLTKQDRLVKINGILYEKNIEVIKSLRRHFDRGHLIFVWSHGGGDWAAEAVKALGIGHIVTATLPKPDWAIDNCKEVIDQTKLFYIVRNSKNS